MTLLEGDSFEQHEDDANDKTMTMMSKAMKGVQNIDNNEGKNDDDDVQLFQLEDTHGHENDGDSMSMTTML